MTTKIESKISTREAIIRIKNHIEIHHTKADPISGSVHEAFQMAINALGAIEQIRWERDFAVAQLEELGLSLGKKVDGVFITKEEHDKLLEYKTMYEDLSK